MKIITAILLFGLLNCGYAKGITVFDSTQLAQLEEIAAQCPITGGSAVFRARSLLELAGEYDFDVSACDSVQGRSNTIEEYPVTQTASPFTFIPNPAAGMTKGQLPFPVQGGRVSLYDALGREQLILELGDVKTDVFEINTEKLMPGIYYCRVNDDSGNLFLQTLIISRN